MSKGPVVDKLLYTPVEAAHALGVSRSTLYVLMASGDISSVRIGSSRRIPVEGLRRYVENLSTGTSATTERIKPKRTTEQPSLWP